MSALQTRLPCAGGAACAHAENHRIYTTSIAVLQLILPNQPFAAAGLNNRGAGQTVHSRLRAIRCCWACHTFLNA